MNCTPGLGRGLERSSGEREGGEELLLHARPPKEAGAAVAVAGEAVRRRLRVPPRPLSVLMSSKLGKIIQGDTGEW